MADVGELIAAARKHANARAVREKNAAFETLVRAAVAQIEQEAVIKFKEIEEHAKAILAEEIQSIERESAEANDRPLWLNDPTARAIVKTMSPDLVRRMSIGLSTQGQEMVTTPSPSTTQASELIPHTPLDPAILARSAAHALELTASSPELSNSPQGPTTKRQRAVEGKRTIEDYPDTELGDSETDSSSGEEDIVAFKKPRSNDDVPSRTTLSSRQFSTSFTMREESTSSASSAGSAPHSSSSRPSRKAAAAPSGGYGERVLYEKAGLLRPLKKSGRD